MDGFTEGDVDTFLEQSKEYLSEELKGETMTIAQQLKDMGRQEGKQEGKREESKRVAINLLTGGISVEVIAKATGLSINTVKALKARSRH